MVDEAIKAIGASYIPIQAIKPIANDATQAKLQASLRLTSELQNRINGNIASYHQRMAEFQEQLEAQRLAYSEEQTNKRLKEIEALALESSMDPKVLEEGLGKFADLFRFAQFNHLNSKTKDILYAAKKNQMQAAERLYQIKKGQEAEAGQKQMDDISRRNPAISQSQNNRNLAAVEFQKAGERDFLS